MKLRLGLALAVLAGLSRLAAASFVFNSVNLPPDLLLGFRQTGGSQELVVDLGSVARFYNAIPGTNFTIGEYNAGQLARSFSGLDGVGFAAFAAMRVSGDADRPIQTVWATRKRTDPAVQSTPWNRQSSGLLANPAAKMSSVGSGAASFSASTPLGPDNTATAVVLASSYANGYSTYLGNGSFAGTWQSSQKVDNVTPDGFGTGTTAIRSDFYELRPGSGAGIYLGYFEFKPNGTLSFTAAGGVVAAPAPTITGYTRVGNVTTVSFTTVAGAQYRLLGQNAAGLSTARTTWPIKAGPLAGTGGVLSLTDTTNDAETVYSVSALP